MRMYDIISKKKAGLSLSEEEIRAFVSAYTKGDIPDYQVSALLMAICLKGMDDDETYALTDAIAKSGDEVDLSSFGDLTADKHSTGGVGDKTTLIVAPIAAVLGCKVAKMSGRGLGHTGGTVDKLESFCGYKTSLSPEEFKSQVDDIGIAVIGQSGNLAPADKKLYALRDVTATVDSIPLITASIMGKKLPAGSKSIVLDVKCGSGAFMKEVKDAEKLAECMVRIGNMCNRRTSAIITNMDIPLGYAIGNALEVKEAIATLSGNGPDDLAEISVALAAEMAHLACGIPEDDAKAKAIDSIKSGLALKKFREWIGRQGGDVSPIDNTDLFPKAAVEYEVKASAEGYIEKMNTEAIGISAMELGAGRKTKEDTIDFSAGIVLRKKTGDYVKAGDTLAIFYTNKKESVAIAEKIFLSSVSLSDLPKEKERLIYERVKALI